MTIKQQGGIFGRNPSFNNVEAENLDVNGDASFVDLNTSGDVLMQIPGSSNPAIIRRVVSGNNWDARFGGNTFYFTRDGANYISAAGGSSSLLAFVTGSAGDPTSPVQAFLHADGRLEMLNNNIVMANGKGIDFSATSGTGTSELFDDYEEGVFTPVLSGTTSAGAATYGVQQGYYRKIGDTVHVWIAFIWSAHTGTGNVKISGLPFTVINQQVGRCPASVSMQDSPWTSGNFVQAEFELNTTDMYQTQVNPTAGAKSGFPLDGSGRLYIQGSYLT